MEFRRVLFRSHRAHIRRQVGDPDRAKCWIAEGREGRWRFGAHAIPPIARPRSSQPAQRMAGPLVSAYSRRSSTSRRFIAAIGAFIAGSLVRLSISYGKRVVWGEGVLGCV